MIMKNNISGIVSAGLCVGCGACDVCEHITFEKSPLGFPAPRADDGCIGCGRCLSMCIYDPDAEDD